MKIWVNNLPEEFNNFNVVFRTIKTIEDNLVYYDQPIAASDIDEENKEATLMDSTSADLSKI